jgi:hypothetical protein
MSNIENKQESTKDIINKEVLERLGLLVDVPKPKDVFKKTGSLLTGSFLTKQPNNNSSFEPQANSNEPSNANILTATFRTKVQKSTSKPNQPRAASLNLAEFSHLTTKTENTKVGRN